MRDAVKVAKEKGLQAIVAVGGGSVLDSVKAVAAGAKYDGDVWDFFVGKAKLWGMDQMYPQERIAGILKLAVK